MIENNIIYTIYDFPTSFIWSTTKSLLQTIREKIKLFLQPGKKKLISIPPWWLLFSSKLYYLKKIRRPRTRSNLGVFPGSSVLLNSKLTKSKLLKMHTFLLLQGSPHHFYNPTPSSQTHHNKFHQFDLTSENIYTKKKRKKNFCYTPKRLKENYKSWWTKLFWVRFCFSCWWVRFL